MAQAGILVTGSWDKTLKVQVHPFSHPAQFVVFLLFVPSFFSQHMVTDAGKHTPSPESSIGTSDRPPHWLLWNSRNDVTPWM